MPRAKNLAKAQPSTSGLNNRRPSIGRRKKRRRVSSDGSDVSEYVSSSDEENNTNACTKKGMFLEKLINSP